MVFENLTTVNIQKIFYMKTIKFKYFSTGVHDFTRGDFFIVHKGCLYLFFDLKHFRYFTFDSIVVWFGNHL